MPLKTLLVCLFMVSHLTRHFANCNVSGQEGSMVFINISSNALIQGTILHTIEPQASSYSLIHGEDCPRDTFAIREPTNRNIILMRNITLGPIGTLMPNCVQQETISRNGFISVRMYTCFVVLNGTVAMPIIINVLPTFHTSTLMFPRPFYNGFVVEESVNATVSITTLQLTPLTSPIPNLFIPNYRITGNSTHLFRVVQEQDGCTMYPVIQVTGVLDREAQSYFEVTLEAYAPYSPTLISASTSIGISVLDRNTHPPQFTSNPLQPLRINERSLPGTELIQLRATDVDLGINGDVRYFTHNTTVPFTVHPLTGTVQSFKSFSDQPPSETSLSVSAQDLGSPVLSSSSDVSVIFMEVDITAPQITIHGSSMATSEQQVVAVSVSEGTTVGETVTTVEITHQHLIPPTLHLMNIGPCECFNLSLPTSISNGRLRYNLSVAGSLDFESTPNGHYQIILTALSSDPLELNSSMELRVEVVDENEPPLFPNSTHGISVMEGTPVGTNIGRITATDVDGGTSGILNYTLVDPFNQFVIDSRSGLLYSVVELDFESHRTAPITVHAEDGGGLRATSTLLITVTDQNDNPPIFTEASTNQTVTIPESRNLNEPIFQFVALDRDSECNGAVEYSIVQAEPMAFSLNPVSGLLYPLNENSLDYESFQHAKLVIRATDLGETVRLSTETTFRISLTNRNDERPVLDPIQCPCFIMENTLSLSQGTSCPALSAHDPDSIDLSYSISSGDRTLFQIGSSSGTVSIMRTLDREDQAVHQLNITVSDGLLTSVPMSLTVIVLDANDVPPTYPSTSREFIIPSDLNLGDFVGSAAAANGDAGYNGLNNYIIASGADPEVASTFRIDPSSGLLYLKQRPSQTRYTFTVSVHDRLRTQDRTSVDVFVRTSGLKNNPPHFPLSTDHRTISEDLPVGSLVAARISANDSDSGPNGELVYEIVADSGNHSNIFQLDPMNGMFNLTLRQGVSGMSGNVYVLNISARDSGSNPLQAYLVFIVTVYSRRYRELVYNPGIPVCFYRGTLVENENGRTLITSLPSMRDSQRIQYNIIQGEDTQAFAIRQDGGGSIMLETMSGSGSVFTDKEAVFITLVAEYGSNFYFCSVTVTIEDINNNAPVFANTTYSFQIYDNTPVESFVYSISAKDADRGVNARTIYRITNTNPLPFAIDPNTGVINVTGSLMSTQVYSIMVSAIDPGIPNSPAIVTVTAVVLHVPNNPPVFSTIMSPIRVSENTREIDVTFSLADGDGSVNEQSVNFFCIASGNLRGSFHVDRQGGELALTRGLDFESFPPEIDLTVMAHDESSNPAFSTSMVTISLQNVNEPPVFSLPVYRVSITEGAENGILVTSVTAVDRDTGSSGTVTYSLPTNVPFSINQTGSILTMGTLNRESQEVLVFNVTASNGGSVSSMAEVHVTILDINDNSPGFDIGSGNSVQVEEDREVGSEITRLSATDRDTGINAILQYILTGGDDSRRFSLDPWTGSLKLAQSLDFETDPNTYQLAITVRDLGTPSLNSSMMLTVEVTDSNDHFPSFSALEYDCEIEEGSTSFLLECRVRAVDDDRTGNQITYSLVNSQMFTIGSSSGIINPHTTIPRLDRAKRPQYILQVEAMDSASSQQRISTAIVRVNVIDSSNVPEFETQTTFSFHENVPANTLLFFAHVHDVDTNANLSTITYSGRNGLFRVEAQTGAVFSIGELDYERISSVQNFTIMGANDRTTPPTSDVSRYEVNILDIDENTLPPVFDPDHNPSVIYLTRSLPVGSHVLSLRATDPEGETIRYDITGGSGYGYFQVNHTSGEIRTAFSLASVSKVLLTVEIRATEDVVSPLAAWHEVTISLSQGSSLKPFFNRPVFQVNTSEETRGVVSAVSAEVNGQVDSSICYGIVAGNEDGTFSINQQTGAILLEADLSREIQPLFNVTVNATKPGVDGGTTLALVVVSLEDANNNRPSFGYLRGSSFNFRVFENFPVGISEPVARVFAVDNDLGENGRLSYTLQSSSMYSPFAISNDTGYLYLTQPLNQSEGVRFIGTVVATETGRSRFSMSVPLNVTIEPLFQQPSPIIQSVAPISLSENTRPGTLISKVNLSNADMINTAIFRIMEEAPMVSILPNTGEVYLTQPLDYENRHTIRYTVEVRDGVNQPTTTQLTIIVSNENDNRPLFTNENFSFQIREASLNPQMVGRVTASDRDLDTLTYSLVDSMQPSSMNIFTVEGSGLIMVSSRVNREELPVHTLTVAVTDSGNPPLMDFATVTVSILDSDDHTPLFLPPSVQVFIPEDASLEKVLHTVMAFDPDLGTNAGISYQLITASTLFTLNSTTGELRLSRALDAEVQQVHSLEVRAFNPNNLSSSSIINLNMTVMVLDVLDSPPELITPSEATIRENYPAYSRVTQIESSVTSRQVYYSIIGGNERGHFLIESLTGTIRTTTSLDREKVASYRLVIQGAFEIGFELNVSLTIRVLDFNDERPRFPSQFQRISVPENSQAEFPLPNANLGVVDPDEGLNGVISSYVIADSFAASVFSIDTSGNLMLKQNQQLDRENRFTSLTFDVYAIDSGSPMQYSMARVQVDITDMNEPPRFEGTNYTFFLSIPVSIGTPQFRVQAVDTDSGTNGELTYSISGSGDVLATFAADPSTGNISVTNSFMLRDRYFIMLSATDGGGLTSTTNINVIVRACNFRNLTFSRNSAEISISVLENVTANTTIVSSQELEIMDLEDRPPNVEFSLPVGSSQFYINRQDGTVSVLSLDREAQQIHRLVVQATDLTDPGRVAQAEITVTMLDVNDNSPCFITDTTSCSITEPSSPGTPTYMYSGSVTDQDQPGRTVLVVNAVDFDEQTRTGITYSFTSSPQNSFSIGESTGVITLTSTPDATQLGTTIQLIVQATDGGNPPRMSSAVVFLSIFDSRAPMFVRRTYSVVIPENTTTNTPILNVTLQPSAESRTISYRFGANTPTRVPFSVSNDGVVTVVDPGLNYEVERSYNLTLRAQDIATGLDDNATLMIQVTDSNDNTPVFSSNGLYNIRVREDAPRGFTILQVEATDADSPPNSLITYRFRNTTQSLFSIEPSMGVISLNGELDYEQMRSHEMEVLAEDGGSPSLNMTAVVIIDVMNINDNRPVFRQPFYQAFVRDNDQPGPTSLFVSATDQDNLMDLVYGIVPGPGSDDFSVSNNGRLILNIANPMAFFYTFNVSASDGDFSGYATIMVSVEGVNLNPPMFNQTIYPASVSEGSNAGVFITQVFATDSDRGSNGRVTYFLQATESRFSINSTTGVILTAADARTIDRETTPTLALLVIAMDGGSFSGNAEVRLTVNDVNDNPPEFDPPNFFGNALEGVLGAQVLTVMAFDRDLGQNSTLHFSIISEDSQLIFNINPATGVISSDNDIAPDFNVRRSYTFAVSVRDNGVPPLTAATTANVTINIIQSNVVVPSFQQSMYSVSIEETAQLGDTVIELMLDPATTGMCLRVSGYMLIGNRSLFFILRHSDSHSSIRLLDNRLLEVRNYTVFVQATCFGAIGNELISTTVTIQVLDVNTPPVFSSVIYRGSVPENSTTSITLDSSIRATDQDLGENGMVSYRLRNHNATLFDIGSGTGVLTVMSVLDFESEQTYMFTVEAFDGGSPPTTATAPVIITVTDTNDNPPVFNQSTYHMSIFENTSVSTSIFTAIATDLDTNSVHNFSISGSIFTIGERDGEVELRSPLDRETQSNYSAEISVFDGIWRTSADLIVTVKDSNDNPPQFTQPVFNVTIRENFPVHRTFVQVSATDADEGDNAIVIYEQVTTSTNNNIIVDNITGNISFLVSPDFEEAPQLSLNIRATDIFNKFTHVFATVIVRLIDENDNAPSFQRSRYTAQISENLPNGSNLLIGSEDRVEAIDPDSEENGAVTYRIIGQGANYFSIDNIGYITSRIQFDREMNSTFEIFIVAEDGGTPRLSGNVTVHVEITDQNDNAPMFPSPFPPVNVREDIMQNSPIFTTRAEDADSGSNGEIRRYTISGVNSGDFYLIEEGGNVTIHVGDMGLDHEDVFRRQYNLILTAFDGLNMGNASLIINVSDVNDNPPTFTQDLYSAPIAENASIGSSIIRVLATDRDESDQSRLLYSIRNSGNTPEIGIRGHTGEIYVNGNLDFESRETYDLMVVVHDDSMSDNSRSDISSLTIAITDVNDNPPYFTAHNSTLFVQENNNRGHQLIRLEARDRDSDDGRITYSIADGNVGNVFQISRTTGSMMIIKDLDRERDEVYNLTVTAEDNDSPSLTNSTTIIVQVTDVNDNSPTGGHQIIYLHLFNGKAPSISLGRVFVNDSDIINNHTYQLLPSSGVGNILIQNDGTIRVSSSNLQIGSFNFTVTIRDLDNVPANTIVRVLIRDVSDSVLSKSFTMQFAGVVPQDFVDNHFESFLESSSGILQRDLSSNIRVQVLSIQSSSSTPGNTDVTLVVENQTISDGPTKYLFPLLPQHILHINRVELERTSNLDIITESLDLCSTERCRSIGHTCTNRYNESLNTEALGSSSIVFSGLTISHTFTCDPVSDVICDVCPEPSYCAIQMRTRSGLEGRCLNDCSFNPCKNGGECFSQNPGYFCQCPEGYDGRNCEVIAARFSGNSYVVFPALSRRTSGTLSLEFNTESAADSLVLFSGRFDNTANDFISVEFSRGSSCLTLSHGGARSGPLCVKSWQSLNDGLWHTLSIRYNSTVSIPSS